MVLVVTFFIFLTLLEYDSCAKALVYNSNQESQYSINVPGTSRSIKATCKFRGNFPVTAFSHNNSEPAFVHSYESPGGYRSIVDYGENTKDIIKIMNQATSCRQFVRVSCSHSTLSSYAWLEDRHGLRLSYWSGGPHTGTGCSCGKTGTCEQSGTKCNCDKNSFPPTVDEGYITEKDALPLTAVSFGDTGGTGEYINYTISDVECFFPPVKGTTSKFLIALLITHYHLLEKLITCLK